MPKVTIYDVPCLLEFSDGTRVLAEYVDPGVWRVELLTLGVGTTFTRTEADGPDHDNYSDVVELVGNIRWVREADPDESEEDE